MSEPVAPHTDTIDLLLKGVRLLPIDEQDQVLRELLSTQLIRRAGPTDPGPDVAPRASSPWWPPHPLAHMTLLGEELSRAVSESGMKILPVRLPVDDYDRLREWSRAQGFSMAVVIRTLVERFLAGRIPPESGHTTSGDPGPER